MQRATLLSFAANVGGRRAHESLGSKRALLAALLLMPAPSLNAQSLAQRVAAVGADEAVHFSYESRPEVCGDGENIMVRDNRSGDGITTLQQRKDGFTINRGRGNHDRLLENCRHGPVTIELTRAAGRFTAAVVSVAATEPADGRNLGMVTPADAVAYLLDDAVERSATRVADQIVFAATLANAETWPRLLRIARNQQLHDSPRKSAIFWLAHAAGEKATQGLTSLIGDDSDELEVRRHAVFALSQVKAPDTVDAMIKIARTHSEPQIRKDAIFWLGQSRDPKVIAFFEEILRGN